jgi:hypothetical protein
MKKRRIETIEAKQDYYSPAIFFHTADFEFTSAILRASTNEVLSIQMISMGPNGMDSEFIVFIGVEQDRANLLEICREYHYNIEV